MHDDERRVYKRSDHFHCSAVIKFDDKLKGEPVNVLELSSGGLSFETSRSLQSGDVLNASIIVSGFFTEFALNTRIKIKRVAQDNDMYVCGASFIELTPEQAIQLDENVKNDRPLNKESYHRD